MLAVNETYQKGWARKHACKYTHTHTQTHAHVANRTIIAGYTGKMAKSLWLRMLRGIPEKVRRKAVGFEGKLIVLRKAAGLSVDEEE